VQRPIGVYIHIPFCERKCTYCNFNTTDFFKELAGRYVDAVTREIAYWGQRLKKHTGHPAPVDTVYFGGGTPSIVQAEQLAMLIQSCRESFAIAPDSEITIEINPGTFLREKVERWIAAGINRASVGVQSFIDQELVSLSRTHSAVDARRTIELLREAGLTNISLDLIAGLPGQTLDDWESNLRQAIEIRPEHLSLYMLDLKEGTQLYGQIKHGHQARPDDDIAAEMYTLTSELTEQAGYEQYEISNFGRILEPSSGGSISAFRSKHNMKYWIGAPFYGLGCGAHSYDGKARWVNIAKTQTYIERVENTGHAIVERHQLTESDRAAEALFMGLRLREGVNLAEFRQEYGVDVIERYGDDLPRLADAGLIEMAGGRLSLTASGRLLSNEVFVSFI
jgi:oxygen-independent coproporphyrinogen III oxidase